MNNSLHIHIYWILSLWFTYSTVKCSPNVTGMDSEFNSSDELTTVGIMSSATRTSAELSSAYPDADLMTSPSAPNSQFNTTSRLEETTHLSDADLMTSSSQSSKFVIVSHPGETTNLSDVDVMTSSAQSSQFTTTSHLEETTKLSDTVKHEEFIFDAGSNSTIECEMSSESSNTRWDLSCMGQDNGLTQIIPFYNGEKISIEFADAFDVQSAETGDRWASVVTLLNIGPHHAGQYKCLDASDDLVKMWQRISIIARKLECSVNSTDVRIGELDSVLISCRVTYVGDLKSAFHCLPEAAYPPRQYTETGTVSRIVGNSYNVTSTLQTSIYDHVIIANREQNGHQLTCEVEMTSESIPGVEPAVSMGTWVSKPLTVTYGPIIRNMSLDEQHSNVMTCYVDGNPQPNITWLANKNDANVGGHRLNMCGLAVVRGWVTVLRPDDEILTLILECVVSGNNIRTSIEKSITNSRGSFKAACPSIAATTEAPGKSPQLTAVDDGSPNSNLPTSNSETLNTSTVWLLSSLLVVAVLVICGTVIAVLVVMLVRRQRRRTTMRQKADPTQKASRSSVFKGPRASGLYDEIGDSVSNAIINDAAAMEPYDEIPYATVNITPYQNLASDTHGRGNIGANGRSEDDPGYMVPLTDLYNTDNTDRQSLINSEERTSMSAGYLILHGDPYDVTVGESVQTHSGDVPVRTPNNDVYAVVQKRRYQPLEPKLPEQQQIKKTESYTQLEGNEPQVGVEPLKDEQATLLAGTIGLETGGQDEVEMQDGDLCKNKHEYNQLDPNTKESLTKEYTPLGQGLSTTNGQRTYHELTPSTREPTVVLPVVYAKLQQQDTTSDAGVERLYHGLDSTTRETEPLVPKDYTLLI